MIYNYLMLLAFTNDNCLSPALKANDPAKAGCVEIAKGASSWAALLTDYSSVLPQTPQLASLRETLTDFQLNETEAVLVQRLVRTFAAEEGLSFGLLSSDARSGNVFSSKSKEHLQNWLKKSPRDRATGVMRLRYILSILTETRLARIELVQNFHDLKYMLAVAIAPQMIVMCIILYHLCMLKRRERKMKKQLEQSNRDQMLLTRLSERRARREYLVIPAHA